MSLTLDPEIAEALAPMAGAMADATPPAVGDVAARRAMWEPIIGAAGTAQPFPADVTTSEYEVTAAPARLEDATGLPPAYIEVGQLDVFRDEDTAYATKLSRAGVPVEFHLHPGAPHEFDSIAFNSDVARRAIADRVRVLKSI